MSEIKAKTVIVGNTKGGVGKSSTTMYLAAALSIDYKKKVLVIECDSQKSILKTREANLYSKPDISPPYEVIYSKPKDLTKNYDSKKFDYDVIFFDMPRLTEDEDNIANEEEDFLDILFLTDFILIPVTGNDLELDGATDFVEILSMLKKHRESVGLPYTAYAYSSRSRRKSTNDPIIVEWAKYYNIDLFDNFIKESKHHNDLTSTLISISSFEKDNDNSVQAFVQNYQAFINEFYEKLYQK